MNLNLLLPFLDKVASDKAQELKKEIESFDKKDDIVPVEKKAETEQQKFLTYWDLLKKRI